MLKNETPLTLQGAVAQCAAQPGTPRGKILIINGTYYLALYTKSLESAFHDN